MATRCEQCHRQLMSGERWKSIPVGDRERLYRSFARAWSATRCHGCRPRDRRKENAHSPASLEWTGGWVRDGLVMRPAAPRPVDVESPYRRAS